MQPFNFKNMDMPAPVADQPCRLQFAGYEVTPLRCTPNIWAKNSWVRGNMSL